MLEVDYSLWPVGALWIQIFNFLILVFFMNILLYKPIRSIVAKRKEAVNSLQREIDDYQSRSDQNEKGINDGMILAQKDGLQIKDSFKAEGHEQGKHILGEAGASVDEKLGKAKKDIDFQILEVRKSLESQINTFSMDIAEKVLGRSIQ
ncbi:MAG: ATP synthase F0 subunit B [Deltaproteobacteria bacterium]|nr:ATP synthase F0 subunit B [Deltaproteobacteria bacterium]